MKKSNIKAKIIIEYKMMILLSRKNEVVEYEETTKKRKPKYIQRVVEHHQRKYTERKQIQHPQQESRQYKKQSKKRQLYINNQQQNNQTTDKNQEDDYQSDYNVQKLCKIQKSYRNLVQIDSKSIDQYTETIEKLLNNNHPFVMLYAFGPRIEKAFLVAQNVCKKIKNLDRINIPGLEKIQEIWYPKREGLKIFSFFDMIPTIKIQLCLGNLTTRHIGFQSYKINVKQKQLKDTRPGSKNKNE